MTVLEALSILEAATLECKKRDVDTPAVKAALDLLEQHIRPDWLVPRFRHHTLNRRHNGNEVDGEGQQQVLRATFPGVRDSVKELVGKMMDALAREFHETHDLKVKDELERLVKEYGKLKQPWVFVAQ
jgi:hypothetical protein